MMVAFHQFLLRATYVFLLIFKFSTFATAADCDSITWFNPRWHFIARFGPNFVEKIGCAAVDGRSIRGRLVGTLMNTEFLMSGWSNEITDDEIDLRKPLKQMSMEIGPAEACWITSEKEMSILLVLACCNSNGTVIDPMISKCLDVQSLEMAENSDIKEMSTGLVKYQQLNDCPHQFFTAVETHR